MSFIQWCCERGAKSHRKSTKKPWRSRSSRYSFHKHFTTFFYLFLFFNYFTLSLFFYTFFTHDIYPHPHLHPHPRPTTSIHDPRPTTFSYTPKDLAVNHLPLEALPAVQTWTANCKRDRKAVVTWHFAVCGLPFPTKNLMLKVPNILMPVQFNSIRALQGQGQGWFWNVMLRALSI